MKTGWIIWNWHWQTRFNLQMCIRFVPSKQKEEAQLPGMRPNQFASVLELQRLQHQLQPGADVRVLVRQPLHLPSRHQFRLTAPQIGGLPILGTIGIPPLTESQFSWFFGTSLSESWTTRTLKNACWLFDTCKLFCSLVFSSGFTIIELENVDFSIYYISW